MRWKVTTKIGQAHQQIQGHMRISTNSLRSSPLARLLKWADMQDWELAKVSGQAVLRSIKKLAFRDLRTCMVHKTEKDSKISAGFMVRGQHLEIFPWKLASKDLYTGCKTSVLLNKCLSELTLNRVIQRWIPMSTITIKTTSRGHFIWDIQSHPITSI